LIAGSITAGRTIFGVKMDIKHYWHVAINSGHFWLGLSHDLVEDGYLSKRLLRYWKSLDAITRRDGEMYFEYIARVKSDDCARDVKVCDIKHNLIRNGGAKESLAKRYNRALTILECDK
jgi:hypothetical protein